MVNLLIITLFTNINYSRRLRIYLFNVIIVTITYTLTISAINNFYPYANDSTRDVIATYKIIESGFIYEAQGILKKTEPYYATLPAFPLLLGYLTLIIGDINFAYLIIGIIQLLGIILGVFILLLIISKYNIVINKTSKNIIMINNYLIRSMPFIGSLLIIGLPYGFFTITATQPQSISLLLTISALYLFVILINNVSIKSVILIFTIVVLIANIYHALISILLFIFIIGSVLYSYSTKKISAMYISSIVIFTSVLIIIYWYEPSSILRINTQLNRIIDALQATSIATSIASSGEYLSEGFKFYAYSFALLLATMLALLCVWILNKFKLIIINNKYIFSSFNIYFVILIITVMSLAFISVMANPSQTGGLGRYLFGQGAIFILSLIIVSNILTIIMYNKKILIFCLIFIYSLSGLTQPYWNPDYTFTAYSSYINYENIKIVYNVINKDDIVYLTANIPIIYKPVESTDYLIKLSELKSDYTHWVNRFLNGEPLFHKISLSSQSVINFLSKGRSDIIENSNNFNVIFMSNRHIAFYTTPSMIRN
ncbi:MULTISPECIES: hypothetical protein [Candidatus Nitrosocaldus]|nr:MULTISPECIES: hypothetical protein [Candidatus Nitrosocaldus]